MQIRQVDPSYLKFLTQYEPHIPEKSDRPWLWPVRINGIDYGIPLTTQETAAGHIGWLRCAVNPNNGLYLRYMIPLPSYALQPAKPLSEGLKEELLFWEYNRQYIEAEVQILHRLRNTGQMDSLFECRSCDYGKLEKIYTKWQPGKEAGHFSRLEQEEKKMPVSKSGKQYYTKEQYQQAVCCSALEYAQSQGYELIRENRWYRMKEHDSMVFTPQGRWFWNSRNVNGGALEFMMYYEGKTITEAVLTLSGELEQVYSRPLEASPASVAPARSTDTLSKEFTPPVKSQDFRRLFSYLCNERGLDKTVVQEMIRQERLYQTTAEIPGGRVVHNAVFVYRDPDGAPVGAFLRGMYDRPSHAPYKRDVPGSDKRWGWLLTSPENKATSVRVFEGAIDAASDASMPAGNGSANWKTVPVDRLSLEGVGMQPLRNYLQQHPDIRHVELMLDADTAGRNAAAKIAEKLQAQGYEVDIALPPFGKDWNEVLCATRALEAEQPEVPQPASPEI